MRLPARMREYHLPSFCLHTRRILYIGKATAGAFRPESHETAFDGPTRFWSFAREISRIADPKCSDLSNLAWSNIFKQGVLVRNPDGDMARAQKSTSVAELRGEVEELRPTIIVCENAGSNEDVIKSAFDITDGLLTEQNPQGLEQVLVSGEKSDLWYRPQYANWPPLFWMYHPQGKSKAYTNAAIGLVQSRMKW